MTTFFPLICRGLTNFLTIITAFFWLSSNALFEQFIVYDSSDLKQISPGVAPKCGISMINEAYEQLDANNGSRQIDSCVLTFEFTQDIDEDDPVGVYYQLTNFFQNHRRYVRV